MPTNQPAATDDVVNVVEAATILGVSRRIVQRRILDGEITARKLPGRTGAYIIDRAELTRYQRDTAAAS